MAESSDKKTNSPMRFLPAVIIALAVVVVVLLLGRSRQPAAVGGKVPAVEASKTPKTAEELIKERMDDKAFLGRLDECNAGQEAAAREVAVVDVKIAQWVENNAEAKALSEKIEALASDPTREVELLRARQALDAMMSEDPVGKDLLVESTKARATLEQARIKTAVAIGAKLREQTAPAKADKAK